MTKNDELSIYELAFVHFHCQGQLQKDRALAAPSSCVLQGFFVFLPSLPKLKDSFINNSKASFNWTKLSADAHFNSQAKFRVTHRS